MTSCSGILVLLLFVAPAAQAETLLAARTIRAHTIIGPDDVVVADGEVPGAISDPAKAIGLEARVALYSGRPIRSGDLGPPAIVERNAVVLLVYRRNGLTIVADGRALGRGGVGDRLRVMNLASRSTVSGVVQDDGTVHVLPPHS